jgi:hypothetical protein
LRRVAVELEPLEDAIVRQRTMSRNEGACPPADYERRQIEFETWARKVGWRS